MDSTIPSVSATRSRGARQLALLAICVLLATVMASAGGQDSQALIEGVRRAGPSALVELSELVAVGQAMAAAGKPSEAITAALGELASDSDIHIRAMAIEGLGEIGPA